MVTFVHKIADVNGLHARNAMGLAHAAMACDCQVYVSCKGKTADAKQVFNLIGLLAKKEDELVFRLDGADEEESARTLQEVAKAVL